MKATLPKTMLGEFPAPMAAFSPWSSRSSPARRAPSPACARQWAGNSRHLQQSETHFIHCSHLAFDLWTGAMYRKGRPIQPRENLGIGNVADEWDAIQDLRDRLRNGGPLLHPKSAPGEDIPTCVHNKDLLQPFLTRMSLLRSRPVPAIEPLREEVESIYERSKRGKQDGLEVVRVAWSIRKLLGFIKMKARRKEVSTATCHKSRVLVLQFVAFITLLASKFCLIPFVNQLPFAPGSGFSKSRLGT